MRAALALLLSAAACAHIDLNACTERPLLNDEKPDTCLEFPKDDLAMCAWVDDFGGTYLYRHGCFSEWKEAPDEEMHVP